MALNSVTAGNTANATDINQYKEALEGTRDFSALMKAASGTDFYVRLANTGGGQYFIVQNSSAVTGLQVDSAGVVTPTTLQVNGVATPADTVAGRVSYDTTKNVLVYGNGTQVVEIADGASTTLVPLSAQQSTTNDTLETITDWTVNLVANGTYVMELVLIYMADGTPDIKFKWDIGSVGGCTIEWGNTGAPGINASVSPSASTTYNQMHDVSQTMILAGQGTGADNKVVLPLFATIHNSTTAGNLNFQWAQNVTNATAATIEVGSYMKITRNA